MHRTFALIASTLAFLAVGAGAFGAHGLEGRLPQRSLEVFEVAVRYQMYHALGLFAIAWICASHPGPAALRAGWLMVFGVLLFSGSLYVLSITGKTAWGVVTPIGGLLLMIAWVLLFCSLWKSGRPKNS